MASVEPIVLDTSILVDLLRADARARALVASLDDGADLWGVTVTRMELLAGARLGDGPAITALLGTLHWIDVDPMLADLAGRMAAHFGRTHPGVGTVDYLIAAGTRLLGARLLTRNVRHFPMLADLRPAYDRPATAARAAVDAPTPAGR